MHTIIKYLPSKPFISHRTYSRACIAAVVLILLTIGVKACGKIEEMNRKPSPIDSGIEHGSNINHNKN